MAISNEYNLRTKSTINQLIYSYTYATFKFFSVFNRERNRARWSEAYKVRNKIFHFFTCIYIYSQ